MTLTFAMLAEWMQRLMWPMGRIVGFMLIAPLFSAMTIPRRVRVGLVVALAVLLAPVIEPPTASPFEVAGIAVMARELMIGGMIGLMLRLVIEAVTFGGQVIGLSMGLGFGEVVDPVSGARTPQLGQFYGLLATLLFIAMDGHLALIEALAMSFSMAPIGNDQLAVGIWREVVMYGEVLFSGAVRVALPAVTAILVVNLGFGVMSRAAPGMNLFAVGFPTALAIGFLVIWLSLGSVLPVFQGLFTDAMAHLGDWL
ncbi:MAG: flagellar biosynthetic protein FliR [Gammaproteobacteria bacterium HGW-Gammaproteobacteria-6]|jgi:flagellar biosynthetic protein FliR|nr:MAG: flagellar biosynthetic protein FliR [Gammaproteobacteria bacterium HGW-Gammaproteobacteria-6]PKM15425.1 MAG: flagellar biosynthetic protein FliR [Gammaproteobacteria bacterium HGW-Gammaproteobacteria-2]